ncbi:GTPase-associated protein 1-related protein [Streptoverticillium reticulum]|uniref:GTPase-associated protein 1-related protein n=1 Tax=Streptoverticillium reticulum TaxID=1433415 RepID=UPI0039BFF406
MNVQQLHYTSAAPGPDGSGFRFTAVSDDLPAALLGEVEQLVGYEPPRDAPARPSAAELAAFPVAFSHHRLSDGSRLLCRAVYTGTDYSGRYGNFHAHAVRLPDGDGLPGRMLPIEAWESPFWADRTPEDGVPDRSAAFTPGRHIDRTRLLEFVRARAQRLEPFLRDVRTLFRSPDAPQLLVVEHDSVHIAHWIAVASSVLPRELADRLTFTTYTRRPLLARQQIVGTLPDADAGGFASDHRYRIHDCTGGRSSPGREEPDPWAAVAARLWLAGRPELVAAAVHQRAGADHGAADDVGHLAALAAVEGVALDTAGRTAAAHWARVRSAEAPEAALLLGLAAGGTDRSAGEWAELAGLADEFAPLAEQPAMHPLKRDLLGELERAAAAPLDALLSLFRLAEALDVDRTAVLPVLAARLGTALLDGPEEERSCARVALDGRPVLAAAVLDTLDRAAATGDPRDVARVLAAELPGADLAFHPHLRVAAATAAADDPARADRPGLFTALLKAAGTEHRSTPSVLRTAFRLVWGDTPLRPVEAGTLLAELPAAWHRAAGLDDAFVRAALDSTPGDPEAPELAKLLLLHCAGTLEPRHRAALLLLELAGDIAAGEARAGCAGHAVALRAQALPLEAGIEERVSAALAGRLLGADPPLGELLALVRSGDEHFLRAYAEAARHESVADRMRSTPAYAADCFTAWQTAPGDGGTWDEIRTGLLASVLRPVVRRMPAEDVEALLASLRRRGGPWAEQFRDWNRPGVLSRVTGRWRARNGNRHGPGDIEPPREERHR